ncbi:response regulator transcription factor [Streptomyces sp. NBC_01465]|uniref:response regulator transcription factor n=1 Tax=Streptomyces sp. NBC_01465 TaxID=2903878 RepID=UPI002E35115A|nr:response regulator transcription factor [Streptomyces sp. NBC_01465]
MHAQRVTVTVHASDPLSRAGVASHLRHQPAVQLVEQPADGEPAAEGSVAVVLLDQVDEASAAELRKISRGGAQRIVLIARELREPELLTVVEHGVRAILWRQDATEQRLLKAVQSAARGEGELPPDLISRLLVQVGRLRRTTAAGEAGGTGAALPLFGMATREVDVVRLIAEGLDTRQISEKLAYSERTVKNILHALMTRLQLTNRAHAVAYALREGYI